MTSTSVDRKNGAFKNQFTKPGSIINFDLNLVGVPNDERYSHSASVKIQRSAYTAIHCQTTY